MKLTLTAFLFILCYCSVSQVLVSNFSLSPDPSTILDVNSNNKGMLVPRLSLSERNSIALPAHSLLIYQTDNIPGYYFNSGTPIIPIWTMLESTQSLLLKLGKIPISELPFNITQSGSYYLTQNLTASTGITISVSNVHIDLNGNTLNGTSGNTSGGIVNSGAISNITIINGFVTNWGQEGIDLFLASSITLSDLTVSQNGFDGINSGRNTVATRIIATSNGYDGIDLGESSTIENSVAEGNTNGGIEMDHGAVIKNCVAKSNMSTGIRTTNFGVVTGCSSYSNNNHGFSLGSGTNISGCSAKSNGQSGFFTLSSCRLRDNVSNSNTKHGYEISGNDCVLKNNHAQGNTLSGFLTTFNRNQFIDNTSMFNNTYGYSITGIESLLIRNTAGSNTTSPFLVTGFNVLGTVVTSANINTNTNPNANISL